MNYFEKANILYEKKDYKKALEMYRKAIEIKDNEAAALYNSAVCLIKLKEYKNAIMLLKSAIGLKQDSRYFFNLGYCHAMLNNKKKALLYFNTAWSLDNSDTDCERAINMIIRSIQKKAM